MIPAIAPFKHFIIPLLKEGLTPSETWDRMISKHGITLPRGPLGTFFNKWHMDQARGSRPSISIYRDGPPTCAETR